MSSRPASPSPRPATSIRCSAIAEAVTQADRLRPGPVHEQGHRARRGEAVKNGPQRPQGPRVLRHQPRSHRKFKLKRAQDEVVKMSVEGVQARPPVRERRRVQPGGRQSHRAGIPGGGRRGGDRSRAPRTINIPDTVGYATPQPLRERSSSGLFAHVPNIAEAVDQRPLPQRSGPGGGQQPGGGRERRPPGGMHDQRAGRAGGQRGAGRGGHGPADAARHFFGATTRIRTRETLSDQLVGWSRQYHRHPRAAEQGHRRAERLRPRGRHPPGRHPQGADDLRGSCAPRTLASARASWCSASIPAGTPCAIGWCNSASC